MLVFALKSPIAGRVLFPSCFGGCFRAEVPACCRRTTTHLCSNIESIPQCVNLACLQTSLFEKLTKIMYLES